MKIIEYIEIFVEILSFHTTYLFSIINVIRLSDF